MSSKSKLSNLHEAFKSILEAKFRKKSNLVKSNKISARYSLVTFETKGTNKN